jgi:hypothetical protein
MTWQLNWQPECYWETIERLLTPEPEPPRREVPHDRKSLRHLDTMKSIFSQMQPGRQHQYRRR